MPKPWKTRHAADYLGLTTRRVRQLCKAGLIEATQDGRDWDIDEESVRAYADIMPVRMPVTKPKHLAVAVLLASVLFSSVGEAGRVVVDPAQVKISS